jgi:hypothetical protein
MEHFYQNIGEDWFTYPNLYKQMVTEANDSAHFIEVGVWKGRSAAYMGVEIINSGKQIKFDCVDTWGGSTEHTDPNSSFFNKDILNDENWLYNDYKNVSADINHWLPKVKPGSILAGHDFHHPPILQAINELLGESNYTVTENCWVFIKK